MDGAIAARGRLHRALSHPCVLQAEQDDSGPQRDVVVYVSGKKKSLIPVAICALGVEGAIEMLLSSCLLKSMLVLGKGGGDYSDNGYFLRLL